MDKEGGEIINKEKQQETITTNVDEFLEYLKNKDKVALEEAAEHLNIPLETLQAWVDFLVEENIVGIEYKFTKPFIYLNKDVSKQEIKEEETEIETFDKIKERYFKRAEDKKIPKAKIETLWKMHINETLKRKRFFFDNEIEKKGISEKEEKDAFWNKYVKTIEDRW